MKKSFSIIGLILMMALTLAACGNKAETTNTAKSGGDDTTYTLKVNTVISETDPLFVNLTEVFKKNVEERTDGKVIVEVYSGGQLGTDEDVLEQAMVGDNVGVITDPGRLSNYVYDFSVLQAPYIASNYEEALKLFETETYKELLAELEGQGFNVLSFNYFQGERELFTKSPVRSTADLKGQRIRSSGSKIVTQTLEDMGANTTVLPWSESYQALQQKVIEGVEVHLSAALGSSIYEVTDYLMMTGHQQLLTGLVVSDKWLKSLPEEYQEILKEESFNAGKAASETVIADSEKFYNELQELGVEVVEINKDEFIKATEVTYDKLNLREIKDKLDKELGR